MMMKENQKKQHVSQDSETEFLASIMKELEGKILFPEQVERAKKILEKAKFPQKL